uniref:Putative golgin subfamily protein a member n=1 Tax=Panstrongylus megistus TaxID=65343 RepID=A0A069DYW2_9HEMI
MFNSMKNQFREKTGKDLPKFTPQKGGLSRQSRQGSESSICSLVLDNTHQQSQSQSQSSTAAVIPVTTQDVHPLKLSDGKVLSNKEINILAKKEEEWRHRLEKKEAELNKKLEKRESDLLQELALKSEEWRKKEHELTQDLLKQTNEVKAAIKLAEEYKRKICQYQEDKDQLEGFQTQEMAKVKHLLLAKEKENNEMAAALKENLALIETLKAEVSRLRPFEEKISNFEDDLEILRHTSEKERWFLSSKLAQSEEQVRHLTDRVAVLTRRSESDAGLASSLPPDDRVQALLGERALLERRLEEAHVHLTDIKASWSAQIASLETQVGRLSRQAGEEGAERRTAEAKLAELEAKLEEELKEKQRLITRINTLTEQCDALAAELKSTNNLIDKLNGQLKKIQLQ